MTKIIRTAHEPKLFSVFEVEGHGQVLVLCDINKAMPGLTVRTLFHSGHGVSDELTCAIEYSGDFDHDRAEQLEVFDQLQDPDRLARLILPAFAGLFNGRQDEIVATMDSESGDIDMEGGRFDA